MREFDFRASAEKPLTHEIVHMQGCIHEYKGQQNLLIEVKVGVLSHLLEIVRTIHGSVQPYRRRFYFK